jgi:hypothetical protein
MQATVAVLCSTRCRYSDVCWKLSKIVSGSGSVLSEPSFKFESGSGEWVVSAFAECGLVQAIERESASAFATVADDWRGSPASAASVELVLRIGTEGTLADESPLEPGLV